MRRRRSPDVARFLKDTEPKLVLEAAHHIDADPVLLSRHWIEDWLAAAFRDSMHNQSGLPLRNINLKLDRSEDRIVQLFERPK